MLNISTKPRVFSVFVRGGAPGRTYNRRIYLAVNDKLEARHTHNSYRLVSKGSEWNCALLAFIGRHPRVPRII